MATRMGRRLWGSRWAVVLAAALAWACGAPGARAEDAPAPADPLVKKVAEHEVLVAQHVKDKAVKALLEDARIAAALHKEVVLRDDLRKRVLNLLETVVRNAKEESDRKVALECVGATGDLDGMKIVKPFLKQPDREKTTPVLMSAIRVAGLLPVSDSVEVLLAMVDDSKELTVCTAAMEALGSFGKVKSKREKILVTLCKSIAKWTPGVRKPKQGQDSIDPTQGTSGEPGAAVRWGTLAPVLPKTLNSLTGQNVNSADQWIQAVKEAPDPGAFFPKD